MSSWYLYLIRSNNGSLYTGITTDVERRFLEHQSNSSKTAKYLRGKGPLQLAFYTRVGTRSEACIAEAKVKKLSTADKNRLIKGSVKLQSLIKDKSPSTTS